MSGKKTASRLQFVEASQSATVAVKLVEKLASSPVCQVDFLFVANEFGEPPLILLRRIVATAGTKASRRHISEADWAAVAEGHIAIKRAIPLVAHVLVCTTCEPLFAGYVEEGERSIARQADAAMAAVLRRLLASPQRQQRTPRR